MRNEVGPVIVSICSTAAWEGSPSTVERREVRRRNPFPFRRARPVTPHLSPRPSHLLALIVYNK